MGTKKGSKKTSKKTSQRKSAKSSKKTKKKKGTKSKSNAGRKALLDKYPELREKIIALLQLGNTDKFCLEYVGIGRDAFYDYINMEKHPENHEYAERVRRARMDAKLIHEQNVAKAGAEDWRASAWWLERRHPAEYGKSPFSIGEEGVQVFFPAIMKTNESEGEDKKDGKKKGKKS